MLSVEEKGGGRILVTTENTIEIQGESKPALTAVALAMLIGNSNQISLSLFAPAQTLASLLASHFPEAGQSEVEALMYAALVLLAITLVVNMMGTAILSITQRRISGRS